MKHIQKTSKTLFIQLSLELTGIGSIVFRDEEETITKVKNEGGDIFSYYKNKIYPFKGKIEIWYQTKKSFLLDLKLILMAQLLGIIFFQNQNI